MSLHVPLAGVGLLLHPSPLPASITHLSSYRSYPDPASLITFNHSAHSSFITSHPPVITRHFPVFKRHSPVISLITHPSLSFLITTHKSLLPWFLEGELGFTVNITPVILVVRVLARYVTRW